MQSIATKTPRGIQEADVWAAADALLAEGQKPTIEKVRMHMGRGSPNTVAPMLDAWFSTLGARLGLNQQTQTLRNSVPDEVLEAAQSLWGSALQHAQEVAEQSLQSASRRLPMPKPSWNCFRPNCSKEKRACSSKRVRWMPHWRWRTRSEKICRAVWMKCSSS